MSSGSSRSPRRRVASESNASAGSGDIFFKDGDVYFAESSLSKDPIGQKLVRAGVLTESHLNKALDESLGSGRRLGEVLIESGEVTIDQIESVVRQQIEDSVFDLLRWELGEFGWESGVEVEAEIPISVSVENLIMEASRRLDEWEMLTRKIPSMRATLGMSPKPPEGALEINITPQEWRVLVLVDGSRTLEDIAEMVGLDEMNAMRTMHGLVSAGLVEVTDPGTEEAEEVAVAVAPAVEEPIVELQSAPEPVAEVIEATPEPEPEAVVETYEPLEPVVEAEPATEVAEPQTEAADETVETVAAAEAPPTEWFQDPDLPRRELRRPRARRAPHGGAGDPSSGGVGRAEPPDRGSRRRPVPQRSRGPERASLR